jgi:hypothetical protein
MMRIPFMAAESPPTPSAPSVFREANLGSTPIRDLKLTIEGTRLEPVVAEFGRELDAAGIMKLRPRFYLSTEWGVAFNTVAIGIPFYLARPDLTAIHVERHGHIEGFGPIDILRYLRHEMGHVINYGYKLYDEAEWVNLFGSITQPYVEEYRPAPFSRRYVRHLPGWYAQKHPDEDWAETFAVWMTPGLDWRDEYKDRPAALAKLSYCDRTMNRLKGAEPLVTVVEVDEEVGEIPYSVDQFYRQQTVLTEFPLGLDGALRAIFEDLGAPDENSTKTIITRQPASALIRRVERTLMANIYRWTGHFPERTRALLRHLAERADKLDLRYPEDREIPAVVGITTLVTALAMNHVHRGSYLP